MSLGRHVDSDELIKASKDHPHRKHAGTRYDLSSFSHRRLILALEWCIL
jgi:hypothetical protein